MSLPAASYSLTTWSPEVVTSDPLTGAVEGVYSRNAFHVEEAISHLIEFFRDGPRNQALLTAILNQVQEAEDAAWQISQAFFLDTAEGDQLDIIGRTVGEPRLDRSDSTFRQAIHTRIAINKSDGSIEDLLNITLGVSSTASPETRSLYPATYEILADNWGTFSQSDAYRLLSLAKPAGVRLLLSLQSPDVGAADGSPVGGTIGAADGSPAGFLVGSGT